MKSSNCDIIKDLLPIYIDKASSSSTNIFIEKHLQNCKECREAFKEMGNTNDIEPLFDQNEQIDFLKKYNKKKEIINIITGIVFTISLLLLTYIILCTIKFSLDVNDVDICFRGEIEHDNKKSLTFEMSSNLTLLDPFCSNTIKDTENNVIYFKLVGLLTTDSRKAKGFVPVEIDEHTEAVYLIDKKGYKRKLWDKQNGVLTRSYLGPDLFVGG